MSASSYDNDEKFEWKKFDQYSFAVIHSASVDEKRKRNAKKRQGNVVSYDIDWIAESELYQIEYIISDNDGHSGKVSIEWLYEAMLGLDDNLKEVLLLKFWYKYSRKEMSQKLGVYLLPIYLTKMDKPDLAMTLTVMDGYYLGNTCLTLEMAYLNARAIAKPVTPWLLELVK